MPRYKLLIEYDGTLFFGWQRQRNFYSVQEALEDALFSLYHEQIHVLGAGRTDTGVHATGQVAHVDVEKDIPPYRLQDGLNFYLKGISILDVKKVDDPFHARFSATSRHYLYKILNRRAPSPLYQKKAWHVIRPLNVEYMQEGANLLLGTHDFNSFRSIECQAPSSIKTLQSFKFERHNDTIFATLQAKSFLHNQVRIMIGTIHLLGLGKWSIQNLQEALEAKDRTKAGPTAPPWGLYLTKVEYE
ncbi:MAG: tRNA pseudouridine(38-40) synthase TruA [Proteobacteria bacterium]|nr:tRNA pseudouridine(38-40) synthase TruA [Pseudomonadota bacterium]